MVISVPTMEMLQALLQTRERVGLLTFVFKCFLGDPSLDRRSQNERACHICKENIPKKKQTASVSLEIFSLEFIRNELGTSLKVRKVFILIPINYK